VHLTYSHVDILVSDLDKAVDYYRRVLGCTASERQVWKRGDFHVEYVIMFQGTQRFYFVQPFSGNLKDLLEQKGEGTIYRLCFTVPDVTEAFRELHAAGVQPENENGEPMTEDHLESPTGTRIIWLPKAFGDLSLELIEEAPMEESMQRLRAAST
jgi:methylmalonyl-CoA/ethylmalonyl-CoA epimerase